MHGGRAPSSVREVSLLLLWSKRPRGSALSQAAEAVPPVGSMSSLGFTLGRVVLCLLVCMPATVPGVFAVSVFVHTVSEVLSPISCEVVSSKASES